MFADGDGGPSGGVDVRELSCIGRILLLTDGTLTHILEAYADEPVQLDKLGHVPLAAEERAEIDLGDDERALRRAVILRGRDSGQPFVYAESIIFLDRLPGSVVQGLLDTDRPIGKLLIDCRLETFRNILAVWKERAGAVAAHLETSPSEMLVARTYEILAGGRPFARITEKFVLAGFPGLSERSPTIDLSDSDMVERR